MSPASLASSVHWAQSALMEIEHLAATEAKVLDKEAYTTSSAWAKAKQPLAVQEHPLAVQEHPSSIASTKDRPKEEYAHDTSHLALPGLDIAELELQRESKGLADRDEEAREAAGGSAAAERAQAACARKSEEAGVASAGESGDFLGRGWGVAAPAKGEEAQLMLREGAGGTELHAVKSASKSGVGVEEAVVLALQGAQQALCLQLQHLRTCLSRKCDLMHTYQDKMVSLAKGKALELMSSLETMLVKLKRQVFLALLPHSPY